MNKLLHIHAIPGLEEIPRDSVDLTVTSPPYDATFEYCGTPWNKEVWDEVIAQLWRVTTPGGVVAWQHRDGYRKDGTGQSGSSELQVLEFLRQGFLKYEIIYTRINGRPTSQHYTRSITPVHIFSKGRPREIHLIQDRPNVYAGSSANWTFRNTDGTRKPLRKTIVRPYGYRTDVWYYPATKNRFTQDDIDRAGIMPEPLARDLILTYSRPGQLVLDCFGGTGTTAKMALLNDRRYLSMEVCKDGHDIAVRRLRKAEREYSESFLTI